MNGPCIMATPGVFVQNNREINKMMVKKVAELSGGGRHERILDLHCGIGNFILASGACASKALGVDSDAQTVKNAVDMFPHTFHTETIALLRIMPEKQGCQGRQVILRSICI